MKTSPGCEAVRSVARDDVLDDDAEVGDEMRDAADVLRNQLPVASISAVQKSQTS